MERPHLFALAAALSVLALALVIAIPPMRLAARNYEEPRVLLALFPPVRSEAETVGAIVGASAVPLRPVIGKFAWLLVPGTERSVDELEQRGALVLSLPVARTSLLGCSVVSRELVRL